MLEKNRARFLSVLFIITSYLFLAVASNTNFEFSRVPQEHYQYLTQGFLSGHLHLSLAPKEELLKLSDPYNPIQNNALRLHDASLFHGKYYLYFGPLPVVAFFLPVRLLTGLFPSELSSVFFFLSLGFIISFLLLSKIKDKYFPHIPESQLLFAGLILGFSSNAPFLLDRPFFYEAAISSAFCFMVIAIFFLYELLTSIFKIKNIFLFSLFLTLTIAGRPHFALLSFFLIPAVLYYLSKHVPKNQLILSIIALLAPALCITFSLGLYNYLRFDSVFEFGQNYQLAAFDIRHQALFHVSHICQNFLSGIFYYFFQPYRLVMQFPYLHLGWPLLSNSAYHVEAMTGIFWSMPIVLFFCAILPVFLKWYRESKNTGRGPLFLFMAFSIPLPIIIILFLCLLSGATQRYEMDFTPYLLILSIISFWLLQDYLTPAKFKIAKKIFSLTGVIGIYAGISVSLWMWQLPSLHFNVGSRILELDLNRVILYTLIARVIYYICSKKRASLGRQILSLFNLVDYDKDYNYKTHRSRKK